MWQDLWLDTDAGVTHTYNDIFRFILRHGYFYLQPDNRTGVAELGCIVQKISKNLFQSRDIRFEINWLCGDWKIQSLPAQLQMTPA
jgi:hypothetical protein